MVRLVLICLLVVGCSTSKPYTRGEKIAASVLIGGQIMDGATTVYGLNNSNVTERNYILGEHPSSGSVIALKAGVVGLAFLIGHFWPDARVPLYSIIGGSGVVISLYNIKLIAEND